MTNQVQSKKPMRFLHMDILRVLAIFLVVFNHTAERGYTLFANSTDSILYFPYMMFSVFCKIAVPIFFMISGALLLPKDESLKQLFTKRILRMAVVLLLISVPFYFWLHRAEGIGITNFFTYIYSNCASTSLWYLYSYIGFLLLLPFLRSMVRNMKPNDFVYLIAGHIILTGIIPCAEYCIWKGNVALNESFSSVIFVTQNVFFALVGYYLEHVLDKKYYSRKNVILSVILSFISILVTCLMTHYQMISENIDSVERLEGFFNSFICIPAMAVYFLIKHLMANKNVSKSQKIITVLGASVFGVYLIEKFCRSLTKSAYLLTSPLIGSFLASLVWCFATCFVAFVIIITLKHIPILKKLVNKFI